MNETYDLLTRVRVKPLGRSTRESLPAANWIPDAGAVVILLETARRGGLDVYDCVRQDGTGGIVSIYGTNIVRALPKVKKRLLFFYSIEGKGEFPFYMLAEFKCWPAYLYTEKAFRQTSARRLEMIGLVHPRDETKHPWPWVTTLNHVTLL